MTIEQAREQLAGFNPQKRITDPDEIAETVIWLCSEGALGVTGQASVVAGGEVMK
jgi:anthraniloyl-CoA monooxygenase